jgi:hypothetical protein
MSGTTEKHGQGGMDELTRRLLTPRAFFVGLILGFGACCVLGRLAPVRSSFRDFQRFHTSINPEGLYFPTALQVRTLARRKLPQDKIAVIVGGSSVMQGIGQSEGALWTRRLQELLGDEYCVLNLAMPGGVPTEYGQSAAEMLLRERGRIIHVCDSYIHCFSPHPDGYREIYHYLHYDMRARGLLLPCPERDAALKELEAARAADQRHSEVEIQALANGWCSFNDLWHVIGYRYVFTIWNRTTPLQPFQARRRVAEVKRAGPKYLYEHYDLDVEEKSIRGAAAPFDDAAWARFELQVRQSVPEEMRPKTLAVVNRFSPYYFRVLRDKHPDLEARFLHKIQLTVSHLRACGLHAVEGCTTLDESDFMDRCHLLKSGGEKLAHELAPAIRQLAEQLGYVADGQP